MDLTHQACKEMCKPTKLGVKVLRLTRHFQWPELTFLCDWDRNKDSCYCLLADLKKTLAVLLDNIMLRLGRLESKVDNIFNGTGGNLTNGTSTATPGSSNAEKVNVAGKAHNSTRCVYGHALLLYTIKQKWLHVSKKRYFFFFWN